MGEPGRTTVVEFVEELAGSRTRGANCEGALVSVARLATRQKSLHIQFRTGRPQNLPHQAVAVPHQALCCVVQPVRGRHATTWYATHSGGLGRRGLADDARRGGAGAEQAGGHSHPPDRSIYGRTLRQQVV